MRSLARWGGPLLLLTGLGCTQALTPALPNMHNTWLDTTTTKAEVARQYGQPADVMQEEAGHSTWFYFAMTSKPATASFVPFVGLFAAGSTVELQQLRLHFAGDYFETTDQDAITRYQNMYAGITEKAPLFAAEHAHVATEMAALGRAFDPESWRTAQHTLRMWQMLRQ
jgi:hypothetical protein